MIRYEGVRYRYPRQRADALCGIDLAVGAGAFVVTTGASGSGKSTLLRCPNGLIPHFYGGAFGGRVVVSGADTRRRTTADLSRWAGFVAQEPETQAITERVVDEVAFGPENLGLDHRQARAHACEVLDALGVGALRERSISTLSGGERQRIAIAAAAAMRPLALALDEPTSQLDPLAAGAVIGLLERLNREHGTTILLAEHRLDRLLRVATDWVVLERGTITGRGDANVLVRQLPSTGTLPTLAAALGSPRVPRSTEEAWDAFAVAVEALREHGSADEPLRGEGAGPALELRDVTVVYGDRTALAGVSVGIRAGHVTAVLGLSGSGKTTMLKLMIGLLRPAGGSVRLFGESIRRADVSSVARTVGYLPQNPTALLCHDSIAAELRFSLRARGVPGSVVATLRELGLEPLAAQSPFDLSGGERQRAALAAVLVGAPPVILLDEPTRGMDSAQRSRLATLLRQLAERGETIVVATHDAELAAAAADDAIILTEGVVTAAGPARRVLPHDPVFAPLVSRIFGPGVLTPSEVLAQLSRSDQVRS